MRKVGARKSARIGKGRKGSALSDAAQSAVDAVVELGHAAEGLKSSWAHITKAGKNGKRAIAPIQNMGKTVTKMSKNVRKAIKRRTRR